MEREPHFLLISQAECLLTAFGNCSTAGSSVDDRRVVSGSTLTCPTARGSDAVSLTRDRKGKAEAAGSLTSDSVGGTLPSASAARWSSAQLSAQHPSADTPVQDAVWNPKPWPLLITCFLWSWLWLMYKNSLPKVLEISAQIICLVRFLSIAFAL